jgi:hypothetical protein
MKVHRDKALVGAAGEYLVLSRLLSRGLLASQAPRGTRKADILVNPLDGGQPRLIQVKTRSQRAKTPSWAMNEKSEHTSEKDLFFCFVDISKRQPDVFVIPSTLVAAILKEDHSSWLATPGKNGVAHKDNSMRRLTSDYRGTLTIAPEGWMDQYLEAWDLIE